MNITIDAVDRIFTIERMTERELDLILGALEQLPYLEKLNVAYPVVDLAAVISQLLIAKKSLPGKREPAQVDETTQLRESLGRYVDYVDQLANPDQVVPYGWIDEAKALLDRPVDPLDFVECDRCRPRPGSPSLCSGCLRNRDTIQKLHAKIKDLWEIESKFNALLYAVGNRYPAEPRFDTALRLIRLTQTSAIGGPVQER